jgi:hypothetical protein
LNLFNILVAYKVAFSSGGDLYEKGRERLEKAAAVRSNAGMTSHSGPWMFPIRMCALEEQEKVASSPGKATSRGPRQGHVYSGFALESVSF